MSELVVRDETGRPSTTGELYAGRLGVSAGVRGRSANALVGERSTDEMYDVYVLKMDEVVRSRGVVQYASKKVRQGEDVRRCISHLTTTNLPHPARDLNHRSASAGTACTSRAVEPRTPQRTLSHNKELYFYLTLSRRERNC